MATWQEVAKRIGEATKAKYGMVGGSSL